MERSSSFVDVRHASVNYIRRDTMLHRWLGRTPDTHSVLRDITFQLSADDQVLLFGAEGAGKTTLLRALTGILPASSGRIRVNGQRPDKNADAVAGYVSSDELELHAETAHDVLYNFGTTHLVKNLPARLGEITEQVGLSAVLNRPAKTLSTGERLRLNVARAALSHAPIILLDDVADELGPDTVKNFLTALFPGRCVIIATRFSHTIEAFELPLLVLHKAQLIHSGTREEIAASLNCPRTIDIWIEGLRYDLLRRLKTHPGIRAVHLLPAAHFSGQHLRIELHSARYLPALYDLMSDAPLIRVDEQPASFTDIVTRLGE